MNFEAYKKLIKFFTLKNLSDIEQKYNFQLYEKSIIHFIKSFANIHYYNFLFVNLKFFIKLIFKINYIINRIC